MKADTLSWLAREAGLPLLEGATDSAALWANEPARSVLGEPLPGSLQEAAARLVDVPTEDPRLTALWQEAADRGHAEGSVGQQWRIAIEASAEGWRLVALPRDLERGLERQRRAMAADLAAGVIHEVANALSAVAGWAELGRRDPSRGDEALETIERSARAARSAAQRLLQSVREDDRASEPVDVAAVVQDVARLLRPRASKGGVHLEVSSEAPAWIQGRPDAVVTIVWNLAQNAVEALPPGGTVWLAADAQGDHVTLTVRDDGPGMDERTHSRVFEPYFTTKQQGTGLGLALVQRGATTLGARLRCDTAPGSGTTFEVRMPRIEAKASAPSRRASGVRERGVEATVLVVEDDEALRELMVTTLDMRGARVHAVGSLAEARACSGPFDVALVDIGLPDGDGYGLIAELRDRGTVAQAALVSGATEPPRPGAAVPDGWLRKPFEPFDLVETVRELVERTAAAGPTADAAEG